METDCFALVAIGRLAGDGTLLRVLTELRDEAEVRAVILTGFEELPQLAPGQAAAQSALLEELGKPVIGAIKGLVSGSGCELALGCSWRIAAADARFVIPTSAFSRSLLGNFLEPIYLTGEPLGAEAAWRAGLVERVVPGEAELMKVAEEQARQIGRNAPLAVKYALAAINHGCELPLSDGLQLESSLFSSCLATEDFREGVAAFLEKREPVFQGQ